MQVRRAYFAETGGPDVLRVGTSELPPVGSGQVRVRHSAAGLNYMDIYHRSGAVPVQLPSGTGLEAVGIIEDVGPGVSGFSVGDRVAYAGGEPGAFSEARVMGTARLVKVPDAVDDESAAALVFKGMTVESLLDRCAPLKAGQFALMYAAAGGIGLIAGQWARARGAKLIGVAAGAEKCALAMENGYHAVIDRLTENDIAARAKEIAGGGLPIVYDSVGRATFESSIDSLGPRGVLVSFGTTSGAPPPVEAGLLMRKGSLYFTRPTFITYTAARPDMEASARAVFDLLLRGSLKPNVRQRYALADVAQAHSDLEAGMTAGASIVVP